MHNCTYFSMQHGFAKQIIVLLHLGFNWYNFQTDCKNIHLACIIYFHVQDHLWFP